jgi:hypothetical protein
MPESETFLIRWIFNETKEQIVFRFVTAHLSLKIVGTTLLAFLRCLRILYDKPLLRKIDEVRFRFRSRSIGTKINFIHKFYCRVQHQIQTKSDKPFPRWKLRTGANIIIGRPFHNALFLCTELTKNSVRGTQHLVRNGFGFATILSVSTELVRCCESVVAVW